MKCFYKYRKDCKEVNTSGMTKFIACSDCDWFDNGVRESGGVIIGEMFKLVINFFKIDKTMETPMYKLLIILYRATDRKTLTNGLCAVIWYDLLMDGENRDKLDDYIKSRKPLNHYLRWIAEHLLACNLTADFYWPTKILLPRKLYLIRHIFYCWLWYWCISKPFKRK